MYVPVYNPADHLRPVVGARVPAVVLVSVADRGYPPLPPTLAIRRRDLLGRRVARSRLQLGLGRPNWGGYDINVNVHGNNPWVNRPYYRDRYVNNAELEPRARASPRRRLPRPGDGTNVTGLPVPAPIQARESYRGRGSAGYGGGYGRPAPGAERRHASATGCSQR